MENTFSKIWDAFMAIIGLISTLALTYIAVLIDNPENSHIIDAVFFGTMTVIWTLSTLLKNKINGQ